MDLEEFKEFAEATRKALKNTENGLDELNSGKSESGDALGRSLEKLITKLQDDLDDILDEYEADDDDDDDDDNDDED